MSEGHIYVCGGDICTYVHRTYIRSTLPLLFLTKEVLPRYAVQQDDKLIRSASYIREKNKLLFS